ncbi:MAG: type II toxin-antitoxin system Phd/YefM family antitoxin [Acidobacteria bacterium]|nr:MAG: type II toxin-antitoxin system Phd/YefM family antitoxin [Acidobacteriota bacterium]
MAKKIPITMLKKDAAKIVREVVRSGEAWTVTDRSRPVAVIVDFETFMAMQRRLGERDESEKKTLSEAKRRQIRALSQQWLEETDVYPWELMKDLVGCVNSGIPDLARNSQKYVMEMIRAKAEKRRRRPG